MRKLCITLVLFIGLVFKSFADEGMWLPLLLGQQVYNDMVKKGLKLTKDQLYNINKASLKDAIIIFGSGCTGEIVSSEGLIFTNHQCGYSIIAASSTTEHNYLKDGFYAKNKNEEIPTNLSVQFLLRIDDITNEVLDSLKGLSGSERIDRQTSVLASINKRMSDPSLKIETRVSPLFKGNQFLAFVYQRYSDVRLVGTPPESVGNFGDNTDNWEWPRHAANFAVFRVYTTADAKPAKYAETNIPLKPKWFLPISIKPIKEGDFTLIYGYPGFTNRYESSYGVKLAAEIDDPVRTSLRAVRLKYMYDEMKKNPATKLQLASTHMIVANYWKFFDGEAKQLIKHDVVAQKKNQEEVFIKWAKGKPEYENIFTEWKKIYDAWTPYAKHRWYVSMEGMLGSPLMALASYLLQVETALVKTGSTQADIKKTIEAVSKQRVSFLEEENKLSDQNIIAALTMMFYKEIPKDQHPIGFFSTLKNKYGPLDDEATYKKYVTDIFKNTMLFNDAKWKDFVANPDGLKLQDDPAFIYASSFIKNYNSKYLPYYQQFWVKNTELARLYLKGIMQMDTIKAKKMYPDASFTMRVSYGNIKSYRPGNAVSYDYLTTSKGILEKYKPGDDEFDLPKNQIELLKKKDFGQYMDPQRKDLVINFITTNDITGGNAGSPVMNNKGELIGLAFDGNHESLSQKMIYDKDLNRTICVDIRYVLWCIDKLGGAGHIIKELKLVK